VLLVSLPFLSHYSSWLIVPLLSSSLSSPILVLLNLPHPARITLLVHPVSSCSHCFPRPPFWIDTEHMNWSASSLALKRRILHFDCVFHHHHQHRSPLLILFLSSSFSLHSSAYPVHCCSCKSRWWLRRRRERWRRGERGTGG
jgi:hypothetical protein